jgi:hypothetical protein
MKTKIIVLTALTLLGCQKYESAEVGASSEKAVVSTDAAMSDASPNASYQNLYKEYIGKEVGDTTDYLDKKKLIKKANISGKVQDAHLAVKYAELITEKYRGIITQSETNSTTNKEKNIVINADSVLHVYASSTTGIMTLRIPNASLLAVLAALDSVYNHIEVRNITTEDVTAQYIENQLRANSAQRRTKRLEGSSAINSDNNSVDAERFASEQEEQYITHKMGQFRLEDDIRYSEVRCTFYQPEKVFKEKLPNASLTKYNVNVLYRIWNNMLISGRWVLSLFTYMFYLWPVFVIGGALYYYYNRKQ